MNLIYKIKKWTFKRFQINIENIYNEWYEKKVEIPILDFMIVIIWFYIILIQMNRYKLNQNKKKMTNKNSLEAYFNEENETTFNKRESEIIEALRDIKRGTAREIMRYLGYEELNEVRPRLTELKQKGIIHEVGKVKEKRTPVSIFAIK